ncbi:hypothetical protein LguiA_007794 [Lonicera macranthoides]
MVDKSVTVVMWSTRGMFLSLQQCMLGQRIRDKQGYCCKHCKLLVGNDLNLPVIHHIEFPKGIHMDDLVIAAGTNAGALLVDGFGEGLLLEAPEQYFDFLRNTYFNLLQGAKRERESTTLLLFYSDSYPTAQFTELNALVTPIKSQVADESGIDKTVNLLSQPI